MKLARLIFASLLVATGLGCIRSENQPAENNRVDVAPPIPIAHENTAAPPRSDSSKAGFPGDDIIRSTPLLAPEEALPPPGAIVALDDLYGWLAWRLADVAIAEKRDNQLAMASLQKEFNAQLSQVRGLRVRLATPVNFVGEKDRDLIYSALREFGYPHAPLTENDFVARFEDIQLSPWPTTTYKPTLYGNPDFSVALQVTPFAEPIPPYQIRYANPSSTSLRGVSFLGNLFSPERTLTFSKENPPVLEGRIHHLEYDTDIPEAPDSSSIVRRRLSLVLSNVRLIDQLPPHPLFLRNDSAPVEALLALATAPPGNVFNEEVNDRFIREGLGRLGLSGAMTFRVASKTADAVLVEPLIINRVERAATTPPAPICWHFHFTPMPLPSASIHQPLVEHIDTDRIPLGSLLSASQLALLKPGEFITVSGTTAAARPYKNTASWDRHLWLTNAKVTARFDSHGKPLDLPEGPKLPPNENARLAKLTELRANPLPTLLDDQSARQIVPQRIEDFNGVVMQLTPDLAAATVARDPIQYRVAFDQFLRQVKPMLGRETLGLQWAQGLSDHVQLAETPWLNVLAAAENRFHGTIDARSPRRVSVYLHYLVTTHDRPSSSTLFQAATASTVPTDELGRSTVGERRLPGLTCYMKDFSRGEIEKDIDQQSFDALCRGEGWHAIKATLHSVMPWYPDFANSVDPSELSEVHLLVVLTNAQFEKLDQSQSVPTLHRTCFNYSIVEDHLKPMSEAEWLFTISRNPKERDWQDKGFQTFFEEEAPRPVDHVLDEMKDRLITARVESDDGKRIHLRQLTLQIVSAKSKQTLPYVFHVQLTASKQLPPKAPAQVPAGSALPALDSFAPPESPLRPKGTRFSPGDFVTIRGQYESTVAVPRSWDEGRPHVIYQFTNARLVDHISMTAEVHAK